MEINPMNRTTPVVPIDPAPKPREAVAPSGTIVDAVAVGGTNKTDLSGQDSELSFAQDKDTQQMVIKIIESKTGKVLEQLPPEQVLRAMAALAKEEEDKHKS
jgi:hypothetical protein